MPITFKETAWKYTLAGRKGELLFRMETDKDISRVNVDLAIGVGVVDKIVKGEKYDLVFIHFGLSNSYSRPFVVQHRDTRKQLTLLKKNKFAFVLGYCRLYKKKLIFYARALQVFDTPQMLDIKRGLLDIDKELIIAGKTKESRKEYDEMDELLEMLKSNGGNDDE